MLKELTLVVFILGTFYTVNFSVWVALAVSLPAWILAAGHEWIYLATQTLDRDLLTIWRFIGVLYKTLSAKYKNMSVTQKFLITAARLPDKKLLTFCSENGDTHLTFREAQERSCQVARCFQQRGYKKGDVVALVMENRIEYCCYWLGLSMLGVVPALINSNLRKEGLLHTITIVKSKAVIYSAELEQAISDISGELSDDTELFCVDERADDRGLDLRSLLKDQLNTPIDLKHTGYSDDLFYIYTSGTTGLPKAAIIKSSRYMFTVYALFCMAKVYEDDVIYSPLPMYHTSAGAMVTGNAILEGVSTISRKKFSARNFWSDCCRNNATIAQYIGEVARYLYSTPESPFDKKHKIRMIVGNGLRPEIWDKFKARFNIPLVNEFYGSTEGNCSVGNISGKTGSVGFISVLFPMLLPLGLILVDEETREPLRDKNGLCIPCPAGKPGELVGRIDKGHPVRDFHGYADKVETGKKIIRDVWKKGDSCFRSGDILEMDELGWLYFKDRSGDTFRWKGENVSTAEVEGICSSVIGLQECVVYGVEVPGCEGRAGMLAIPDPERLVDLKTLYDGLEGRLPSYARPLFIRLVERLDVTATFKLKKRDLQREGLNPGTIKDPLYMFQPSTRNYVELTSEVYRSLELGEIKM